MIDFLLENQVGGDKAEPDGFLVLMPWLTKRVWSSLMWHVVVPAKQKTVLMVR